MRMRWITIQRMRTATLHALLAIKMLAPKAQPDDSSIEDGRLTTSIQETEA